MNRFVVTILSNGSISNHEVVASDEADAAFRATERMPFSNDCRVQRVRWIGRAGRF